MSQKRYHFKVQEAAGDALLLALATSCFAHILLCLCYGIEQLSIQKQLYKLLGIVLKASLC
jgi:hypothetical protein